MIRSFRFWFIPLAHVNGTVGGNLALLDPNVRPLTTLLAIVGACGQYVPMTTTPQTQGGRNLFTSFRDPECHRARYREEIAYSILKSQSIEPTYVEHSPTCIAGPGGAGNRVFGHTYHCEGDCPRRAHGADRPIWPEWVTGEIFDAAARLADLIQTERSRWHHREIARERMARNS